MAARNVTGKDSDAYLSDYCNRSNVRMQEVKEAIGVEARTTILNPTYIKEKMKGEASLAAVFAEIMMPAGRMAIPLSLSAGLDPHHLKTCHIT